jgi:McbB family protein
VDRTYFVRGYDIVEMDDFHLLIADASTSKISSGSVLKLLTLLKARTQTYLSESSLLSMAEAENVVGGEFVEFLRDQAGVILDVTTLKDPEAPFSRVHIYTDAKVISLYRSHKLARKHVWRVSCRNCVAGGCKQRRTRVYSRISGTRERRVGVLGGRGI